MSFINCMLYIVLNCDILGCYSSKDQAINFVLDYINIKLKVLDELGNIEFNLKDIFKNIYIAKTEINTTHIYEHTYYNIEEHNFIDKISSSIYTTEDKNIKYKLSILKEMIIENTLSESSSDDEMYLNTSSSFKLSSINDESSDILDTDKVQEIVYSNNEDENSKITECNNKENSKDEIGEKGNNKNNVVLLSDKNSEDKTINENVVKNHTELLNNLAEKKKKLEKLKEIIRKFNIDYDLYLKMKSKYDVNTIPEIFKDKFLLFNHLDKNKNLENKEKCKRIYINNYDKINSNYISSYETLFSQQEKEEDLN